MQKQKLQITVQLQYSPEPWTQGREKTDWFFRAQTWFAWRGQHWWNQQLKNEMVEHLMERRMEALLFSETVVAAALETSAEARHQNCPWGTAQLVCLQYTCSAGGREQDAAKQIKLSKRYSIMVIQRCSCTSNFTKTRALHICPPSNCDGLEPLPTVCKGAKSANAANRRKVSCYNVTYCKSKK